jgi:hypothetical protein
VRFSTSSGFVRYLASVLHCRVGQSAALKLTPTCQFAAAHTALLQLKKMKFLFSTAVAAAALVQSTSAATCATSTLAKLLTDEYIDQCASDSGYAFTSGVQPDADEVAGMCASDACHSLLADVVGMNLTECTIPLGNRISLFADLVDYVSDQCEAEATPAPTTATPEPTTATPEPTTATPAPTTATPAPTTAIASCTSAQLKYLLTSTYEKQCITDTGYVFTAPYSPTETQVEAMCASESCVNLFAYVASMVTVDCRIPVGGKILLLADLVDYVSDQCAVETPTTTPPATETPSTPTPTTATPVTTCATKVISALLTDEYIDQCASDSGYAFTSGVQPDADEVAGMCGSSACSNLLADVEALGLSECILPVGNKIYLFRDLIDYVSDQCNAATGTPSPTVAPATNSPSTTAPATESPSTSAPATESPSTDTPCPVTSLPDTPCPVTSLPDTEAPTATPIPTTESPSTSAPATESPSTDTPCPVTSLPDTPCPVTSLPDTEAPIATPSPSTDSPTTQTPEPTAPIHEAC